MSKLNQQQWIQKLKLEGFKDITVFPFKPNKDFGEHTHDEHTVHVILKGELIMKDKGSVKKFRQGDRIEFPAGTIHSTKCGPQGCTMIVGVKKSKSRAKSTTARG